MVARKHGLSPKTLGNWVRQYQDEVDDLMVKKQTETKQIQQDAA
ncbi:transposase [Paenibacillus sp. P32E]|nr:transposase [Paenibacillus sp. P32E]